jgi:hypothetical protein
MNFKPAWLELYEAAVLETDNVALQKRIEQAEQALAARLVQMKQGRTGISPSDRSLRRWRQRCRFYDRSVFLQAALATNARMFSTSSWMTSLASFE